MARTSSQRPSTGEHAVDVARWSGRIGGRIVRAWRALPHERRWAAYASIGLFVTLFLPWYQETVVVPGAKAVATGSITGWGGFSFVEAAVLLVSAGVLTLLFQRAEGRPFHLPGGDGFVIMAAGFWTCVLVVWRIFDKQSTSVKGPGVATSGIEWGIFAALVVAGLLAYSGSVIRAAHRPEPPLPGEDGAEPPSAPVPAAPAPAASPAPAAAAPTAPTAAAATPAARRPRSQPASQRPDPPFPERARPPGWLTAPPRHLDENAGDEQLTIPLDPGEN